MSAWLLPIGILLVGLVPLTLLCRSLAVEADRLRRALAAFADIGPALADLQQSAARTRARAEALEALTRAGASTGAGAGAGAVRGDGGPAPGTSAPLHPDHRAAG